MDRTYTLTIIGIACLVVSIYAYQEGANILIIAGTLVVAIGAGLMIIGQYVVRHNRPLRGNIEDIVVWSALIAAIVAIASTMLVVNGIPPKDYLVLFGIIAIGVVTFAFAVKHYS